jgi:hypothetical protein
MRTPRIVQRLRPRRTRQLAWREAMTGLDRRWEHARLVERFRRWGMWVVIAAGAALLLGGLPWLLVKGPYRIDGAYIDQKELAKGSAALVTGLRTAVVAFTAALGAGIALLCTARTYRLTHRGQITDRFTKAPERAATDAARVLGHFIRHHALKTVPPPDPDGPHRGPHADPLPAEPDADVQAALTALTALTRTDIEQTLWPSADDASMRERSVSPGDGRWRIQGAGNPGADLSEPPLAPAG